MKSELLFFLSSLVCFNIISQFNILYKGCVSKVFGYLQIYLHFSPILIQKHKTTNNPVKYRFRVLPSKGINSFNHSLNTDIKSIIIQTKKLIIYQIRYSKQNLVFSR